MAANSTQISISPAAMCSIGLTALLCKVVSRSVRVRGNHVSLRSIDDRPKILGCSIIAGLGFTAGNRLLSTFARADGDLVKSAQGAVAMTLDAMTETNPVEGSPSIPEAPQHQSFIQAGSAERG